MGKSASSAFRVESHADQGGGKVEDDVADAFDGARASTARESSKGMDVPARGKK